MTGTGVCTWEGKRLEGKVRISADSTCDLSRELIAAHNIAIAPLYISMNGRSYRDGVDISPGDLFENVARGGKTASTSAVNVEDYRQLFGAMRAQCEGIVHFTISSEMSACYQNACLAASEMENVFVVDSRNLSTGIGHLVLDAAEMAGRGCGAEEIFRAMEAKKARLDVSFVVDTLDYLRLGGRCSALAALGANLLSLKPYIEVREGVMGVGKKYRGRLEHCLSKYVADRLANPDEIDDSRLFITDSGVSDGLYQAVRAEVDRHMAFREVLHTRAGCTISNHCGPNCLGLLFYKKDKG